MPQKQPYIMMVVPSLPEQGGGGVVQVIGYLKDAWREMDGAPPMRLLVTRGRGNIWLAPFYLLRALCILTAECARGRVALVHVNVASRGSTWRKLTVVAVASLFAVPVVLHLHGGGYRQFVASLAPILARIVGWMFRRARRIIVLGEAWREFIQQTFHPADGNMVVMPNGVPDIAVPGGMGKPTEPRLLFMGRLSREKGLSDLLEALADGSLMALQWSAVIAGDGPMADSLQTSNDAKLNSRVSFPGWLSREQAGVAYSSANIFVLPSHMEGLSIALLEAMAHGMAIVATPVGGHGEVIKDGENGLLVKPGDSGDLATALREVIVDQDLRQRLGRAARDSFTAKYMITRTAEQLRTIYNEAMA